MIFVRCIDNKYFEDKITIGNTYWIDNPPENADENCLVNVYVDQLRKNQFGLITISNFFPIFKTLETLKDCMEYLGYL